MSLSNSSVGLMAEHELSFKEMCTKYEVTPRTLRYYEYIELLSPRRDGRARWYGAREQARMTLILRGRRFGFSLEEIRQWLEIYGTEGNEAQLRVWVKRAEEQIEALILQQAQLGEVIEELRQLRDEANDSLSASDQMQRIN